MNYGDFKTADATRFALADGGDSMEDANFDRSVANNAISYLFTEESYFREIMEDGEAGKLRTGRRQRKSEARLSCRGCE